MQVLITGVAGFIGSTLATRLLERGDRVHGVDNLNSYYDPRLKAARLDRLHPNPQFSFTRLDVSNASDLKEFFANNRFDRVAHLAAQPGVRYSLENPQAYVDANVTGFLNVLEACRYHPTQHLVYASSSSVYGANRRFPFSEHDITDTPVSLYAASKKANELMAHAYSHLFGIPCTGLRFFTVYGPWDRPDMALFKFTRAILEGRPIEVFNHGEMFRDFTYVDDIVEGVLRVLDRPPEGVPESDVRSLVYNIGHGEPVKLLAFIETLEGLLGKKARKEMKPLQPGDVVATCADVTELKAAVGYAPTTSHQEGLARYVKWHRGYYGG